MISYKHWVAQYALVWVCVSTFGQATLGQERTIRVDLGLDSQTTAGSGWNNFGGPSGSSPTAAIANLKDITGALTGVAFTPTWSTIGSNAAVSGTAANYDGTYPAALAGIPASALRDSLYVRDGETLKISLTNLLLDKSYSFMMYGAAGNTGDFSLFTVTGVNGAQGFVTPIVDNSTTVANITGIVPDATQKIEILFEGRRPDGTVHNPGVAGDAIGRWNYLAIFQNPIAAGDYNRDGSVTTADYNVWRLNFGLTTSAPDGNQNGVVDAADYVVWRKAMGTGAGAGLGSGVNPVPEPCTLTLLISAIIGLCGISVRPAHRQA